MYDYRNACRIANERRIDQSLVKIGGVEGRLEGLEGVTERFGRKFRTVRKVWKIWKVG